MPVFDFSAAPEDRRQPECTYTTFQSNEETATPEKPIMILDNTKRQWQHHVCGMFTNPVKLSPHSIEMLYTCTPAACYPPVLH